jgi:phenylacetate-CoA ligase
VKEGTPASSALAAFGNWERAARMLQRAARRSPFVRRQLERSGLTAKQVTSDAAAWGRLAFVTKEDLLEDQRVAPPFGTRCCSPIEDLAMVVESSGTTAMGKEAHYITRTDYARTLRAWGVSLRGMGITASDIVALTFPVGMSGGGVKHADAYVSVGAKVMRIANLSTRAKLDAMAYYGTTVLVATPFYVDRLVAVADEAGIDLRALKVRRIVVATQSVTCDWVQSVEQKWGAKLHEWYGTSAGLIAFSCEQGMVGAHGERGTLHWHPDFAVYEVLGVDSGTWVEGGARGELVGTPLISAAEPLFRIRTRDEVRFRPPGTCQCGSSWPGIESGTVRRLDGMFKVKGVNVWPAHVEATLFSMENIRDYRVRITLDGKGRETMRLDLLMQGDASEPERFAERLSERLRTETGLGFDVTVNENPSKWLHETTGEAAKPRRWVDERMK